MEAVSVSALIFTVYFFTLLAYCTVKKKEINTVRTLYINSILLYGLLLISLSFLPLGIQQEKGFNYIPLVKYFSGDVNILKTVYEFILFIPAGFLCGMQCRLIAAKYGSLYAVMLGLLISLIIEVAQLYLPFNRICDVDDIILNVFGAFFGAVIFSSLKQKRFMVNIMRKLLYY
jgi:glycopeptide antibiotics resistance protein